MSSIGNVLFGKIAIEGFNRLSGRQNELQGLISSGKNDPRPSVDPMRAAKLSAMTEQRAAVDRFAANAGLAEDRLSQTDLALGEVSNIVRQYQQLAIQSANGTLTEEGYAGLQSEAISLRSALMAAANTSDTMGLPLFSGFGGDTPFVDQNGTVAYQGDGGRPALRLTETTMLPTGLNGADVFMAVPDGNGDTRSLFDMVDDLISTLTLPLVNSRNAYSVSGQGRLDLQVGRDPATLSMKLAGPDGSATISAEVMQGSKTGLVQAINDASLQTGVTATLADDGEGIILNSRDKVTVSDMSIPDWGRSPVATFTPADSNGVPSGTGILLRGSNMSADQMIGAFGDAVAHMAAQRAEAGALASMAEDHTQALADRKLRIDKSVAGLEDLDIAAAVTELQSLLLSEQAAQQTFIKINGSTLFDYLR